MGRCASNDIDVTRRIDLKGLSLNQNAPTHDKRLLFVYVVGSLAAIFYLPILFPLHPSASDSYLFGYNNRVGIVLLLVLVAIGAIWTRGLNLQFKAPGASEAVPVRDLAWSLTAVLAGCVAMYLFAGHFGGFMESSYEIDRAWLLSQGKTPYVDFEWPFGPALIYGPLLLSRLFSFSIVQGYYLFWTISCLLGVWILFVVINLIDYPTKSKRAIYILLVVMWSFSILNMGTHYTLIRYASPLLFLLLVHRFAAMNNSRSQLLAALLAVGFTAILFLISPEVAIAHAFSCVCIFFFSSSSLSGRYLIGIAELLLALVLVFGAALKFHLLDTMKASGGGADSFPISFAPYILFFFSSVFLCGCYVFRRFSNRGIHDNTIGLIAYSVPMMAAALGRCDPGHVVFNGLGIFLSSMFYVSNYKTLWKWYRAAVIVILILLPALSGIWFVRPALTRCGFLILTESDTDSLVHKSLTYLAHKYLAHSSPSKRAKWEKTLEDVKQGSTTGTTDLSAVYAGWHGTFLAPLGYKPNGIGSYLSNRVDYGHYEAFENANTVGAIGEKLAEIKDHPDEALLLPDGFESSCQVDVPAERMEMSMLFAFPYFGRAVHPESIRAPICAYVLAHYRLERAPDMRDFMYGLWVANAPSRDAPQSAR
jgi:hypothetical protein